MTNPIFNDGNAVKLLVAGFFIALIAFIVTISGILGMALGAADTTGDVRTDSMNLIARMPELMATIFRLRGGRGPPEVASEPERGLVENFVHLLGKEGEGFKVFMETLDSGRISIGALALGIANSTLMLENAIFSVVPPERAAVLLYRDATKAEEVAPALRITAQDCKQLGVVDVVVPEPKGGAHADPDEAARLLKRFILDELVQIQRLPPRTPVRERYHKFRHMGRYSSRISVVISKERAQIQEYLSRRLEELKEFLPSRAEEVPLEKKEPSSEQPESKE